jgi:hypothetical protein
MAAANAEIAVVAKLKAANTSAGTRVNPQLNTQEPTYPLILVSIIGTEGRARLSGSSSGLRNNTVRCECYAATEAAAKLLGKQVRDALTPDGTPWVDLTNGVQGAFFLDSSDEITEDGVRVQQETFAVWHTPT